MANSLEILMATYNSEDWIAPQIESILSQTYPDFSLLVRDDGSTDRTLELVRQLADRDSRIVIIPTDGSNQGAIQNFNELLKESEADYVMFSDADDVWFSDKIETTLDSIRNVEMRVGKTSPALVHTDLSIVGSQLEPIADSFWKYSGLNPRRDRSLNRLLMLNNVTGCTLMMNRALVVRARPVDRDALMHDHWIALVASSFGEIEIVDRPTMFYRRHGENVTDIKIPQNKLHRLRGVFGKARARGWHESRATSQEFYELMRKQALAFLSAYKDDLTPEEIIMLHDFVNLKEMKAISRRLAIIKHSFYRMDFVGNVGWFLFI